MVSKLSELLSKPRVVVARAHPHQKLAILRASQANGDTVAVIGGGIADFPSIRHSDVGVALGVAGSDSVKDAADVILLNDDFSRLIEAIH